MLKIRIPVVWVLSDIYKVKGKLSHLILPTTKKEGQHFLGFSGSVGIIFTWEYCSDTFPEWHRYLPRTMQYCLEQWRAPHHLLTLGKAVLLLRSYNMTEPMILDVSVGEKYAAEWMGNFHGKITKKNPRVLEQGKNKFNNSNNKNHTLEKWLLVGYLGTDRDRASYHEMSSG